MRLGRVIKVYRLHSELTMRELADEIGIGPATLMRIEHGQSPDGDTLVKVLSWLTAKIVIKRKRTTRT